MTETVKTTKRATKPKKSPAKKSSERETVAIAPTHDEIAQLAYHFWTERGQEHGHAEEDWFRAQQTLASA